MDIRVTVHPRVRRKRPDIAGADVVAAVRQTVRCRPRETEPRQWAGIGMDANGRILEYVAVEMSEDEWLVFHAAPATGKMRRELGFGR